MPRHIPRAAIIVTLFASASFAQETQEAKPLLSGPDVEESRLPGVEQSMTGSADRLPGMSEGDVPAGVFRRAVQALQGEEVADGLRLTPDQAAEIARLQREHARAMREFMAEHQEEINQLRRMARTSERTDRRQIDQRETDRRVTDRPLRRATDQRPQGGQAEPMSDAPQARMDPRELRRRIQAIRQAGPKDVDVQTRVWNVLDEAQQEFVGERIQVYREEQERLRQERYMQRFIESRRAESRSDAPPTSDLPPELREFERSLPQRLRDRLAQLDSDQRVRLLKRLQARAQEQAPK
jgi:hypothetical protein